MDENQGRPGMTNARGLVENPAVLPVEKTGLAAQRAVIRFRCVAANGGIQCRQRRDSGAARRP